MQLGKVRRQARKTALQIFYSVEISGINISDILAGDICIPDIDEIDDYAVTLLEGVPNHTKEIDEMIDEVAQN